LYVRACTDHFTRLLQRPLILTTTPARLQTMGGHFPYRTEGEHKQIRKQICGYRGKYSTAVRVGVAMAEARAKDLEAF
jgi:hypothetical protein